MAGVPATVLFAGITGTAMYQFNVVVPNVASGNRLLQASVGTVQTPGGVYVTLQ